MRAEGGYIPIPPSREEAGIRPSDMLSKYREELEEFLKDIIGQPVHLGIETRGSSTLGKLYVGVGRHPTRTFPFSDLLGDEPYVIDQLVKLLGKAVKDLDKEFNLSATREEQDQEEEVEPLEFEADERLFSDYDEVAGF